MPQVFNGLGELGELNEISAIGTTAFKSMYDALFHNFLGYEITVFLSIW